MNTKGDMVKGCSHVNNDIENLKMGDLDNKFPKTSEINHKMYIVLLISLETKQLVVIF